jgi:hypothetical protein
VDRIHEAVAVACEHGHKYSGSIKGGEFLDWLSEYQLLVEESAPWSYLGNYFCISQRLLQLRKMILLGFLTAPFQLQSLHAVE